MSKTIGHVAWNRYGPLMLLVDRGRKWFCLSNHATIFPTLEDARRAISDSRVTERNRGDAHDAEWENYQVKRLTAAR